MTISPFALRRARPNPVTKHPSCRTFLDKGDVQTIFGLHRPKKTWLTPILGSGCAQSSILDVVNKVINSPVDSARFAKIDQEEMKSFARDLVGHRLGENPSGNHVEIVAAIPPPGWFWDSLATATLLTRLFYELKLRLGVAPRRFECDESVDLDSEKASTLIDIPLLRNLYVSPASAHLTSLKGQQDAIVDYLSKAHLPEAGPVLEQFKDRLKRRLCWRISYTIECLGSGGAPRPLLWSDIQWWADFVWISMVACAMPELKEIVYPGWTDLLLELCCYDNIDEKINEEFACVGGRPWFATLSSGVDVIQRKWSDKSLQERLDPGRQSNAFYDQIADILMWQSCLRRRHLLTPSTKSDKKLGEPPVVSAFLTSFDLELEIAMIRKLSMGDLSELVKLHLINDNGPKLDKFAIVFPVYLSSTEMKTTHTCWLALDVDIVGNLHVPGDREALLGNLIRPPISKLRALSSLQVENMAQPFLVRLTGCPLIRLPDLKTDGDSQLVSDLRRLLDSAIEAATSDLADRPKEAKKESIKNSLELYHAVVISEHSATVQNLMDALQLESGQGTSLPDGLSNEKPGLASGLAAATVGWERFWTLLGVQIAEGAVRHRVGTLLSMLPLSTSGQSEEPPSLCGVAVNRRITAADADFLAWHGLDVVQNNVDDFAPIAARYLEYLKNLLGPAKHVAGGADGK